MAKKEKKKNGVQTVKLGSHFRRMNPRKSSVRRSKEGGRGGTREALEKQNQEIEGGV